ncbi:MAG: CoA-transferase, partial [Nannocystaceae bacterium]
GAKRVIVAMEHCTRRGDAKLLKQCTLPLTGKGVVHEVATDLGYFRTSPEGLILAEIAPGVTVEEVRQKTECEVIVADPLPVIATSSAS